MRNLITRALVISTLLTPFVTPLAIAQDSNQPLATSEKARKYMIVTANPLATAAGEHELQRGGSAVDAMIAAQAVLSLVEPQSSGLGGGAFVVYYDAKNDDLTTFDAREKAPIAATEKWFLDDEGNDRGFFPSWQSGLSVGVPGTPRLLEDMHKRYGKKRWSTLFKRAQKLARNGFPLTQRTSDQVNGLLGRAASLDSKCESQLYFRDPAAFNYFIEPTLDDEGGADCAAKPAGTIITNMEYVQTLRTLARQGADGFYQGEIAQAIVDAVNSDPNIPGAMTLQDLADYRVIEREPVCIDYRGYPVCGMGPPSSGGLAVGQILGIMENFNVGMDNDPVLGDLSNPLNVEVVHLFSQAGRLAFADRNQYVADSDFVRVPSAGMLDKEYLAKRATMINETDIGSANPGEPDGAAIPKSADTTAKNSGTSHISIVDKYGNALSMTTTIESSFGNGVLVNGFLLNNELTDFSRNPANDAGVKIANRVQSGKRPRSSMSPTIVFDGNTSYIHSVSNNGKGRGKGLQKSKKRSAPQTKTRGAVELVTGSPGGSRIIGYTAQSVMNHIDFGLDPQASINLPHYMSRNGRTDIEAPLPGITIDYDAQMLADKLLKRGHSNGGASGETSVGIISQTSGLSIINVGARYLIGGADKRRDGTVGGR